MEKLELQRTIAELEKQLKRQKKISYDLKLKSKHKALMIQGLKKKCDSKEEFIEIRDNAFKEVYSYSFEYHPSSL